jgi:hypothetical protein
MSIYRIYSKKTIYRKGKGLSKSTQFPQDTFSGGFLRRIDCGLFLMFWVFFLRRHRREEGREGKGDYRGGKLGRWLYVQITGTDVDREKGRRKRVALFF